MNRSITQKVLLVIILVTVISSGTLAESGAGRADLPAPQNEASATDGLVGLMPNYWTFWPSHDCPYHRIEMRKNATGYGHIVN